MSAVVLDSVLTCPHCGFAAQETMPTDACQLNVPLRNVERERVIATASAVRNLRDHCTDQPPR